MMSDWTTAHVPLLRLLNVGMGTNAAPSTCVHHYCGNSWVVVPSTTAGDPGGTMAWGICCKCGASSPPARSYGS